MSESNRLKKIQLALSPRTKVFRNVTAFGWTGPSRHQGDKVIIDHPHPLHAGLCDGSSDLIGWTCITVTADMVGRKLAVFTALEEKYGSTAITEQQTNFINSVREDGGIAGAVYTPEEAVALCHR